MHFENIQIFNLFVYEINPFWEFFRAPPAFAGVCAAYFLSFYAHTVSRSGHTS